MSVIMKFGGSSLEDMAAMRRSAAIIARARQEGNAVVAVLSAQSGTTDELDEAARSIDPTPQGRERDSLLSVGEQISTALMAMLLQREGWEAVSLTGWQMGIRTDANHGAAAIESIVPERIRRELAAGRIVLAAGFQGINSREDITTLGRGGSDTTAAALAAALGERECLIYTDVPGVFTADPRLVPGARRYRELTYREMMTMAEMGAKVLAADSVKAAMGSGVTLRVRSSRGEAGETRVEPEGGKPRPRLLAVTRRRQGESAAVSIVGHTEPRDAERVLRAMEAGMLCHAEIRPQEGALTLLLPWTESEKAVRTLHRIFFEERQEKTF